MKDIFMKAVGIGAELKALCECPGLTEAAGAAQEKADEVVKIRTACRACIANCGVIATIKNGRVVKLEGDPKNKMSKGRLCSKGLSGIQALYNPNRIKYPMMRVGERGENKWKRVSWDEALDYVAVKLMEIREKYGAESVMCSTGGGGNPQFTSIPRFCNLFGTPNWFEPGSAQCYLPRLLTYNLMYGGDDSSIADSNALEIYYHEDTPMKAICLWGVAPSMSCAGQGGGQLAELRAKGVKSVVVDPRMTPDAAKADVWLPIRPGTDVALQLTWINYIIENKLYDEEFVMKWTNLPYLVNTETKECWRAARGNGPAEADTFMVWDRKTNSAQHLEYPWNDEYDVDLMGTCVVDGVTYKTGFKMLVERVSEWTIAKGAEVCWLPEEKIVEAVKLYAENTPGGLCIGVATDQSPNSVEAAMGANIIDMLLGNVERPGSLMQRFGAKKPIDVEVVPFANEALPYEQLCKRLGGIEYKGLIMWQTAHVPSCLEAMENANPYPIKAWIDRSGNKLAVLANGDRWVKAMRNLDLMVHMYTNYTSFSAYCDVLLPTTEWLETNYVQKALNTVTIRQPAAHLYETIDEALVWCLIGKYLAKHGHETMKKSYDPEFMGRNYTNFDSMTECMEHFTQKIGMTWEEFKTLSNEAPYEYATEEEFRTYYLYKELDENGKPRGFMTGSKKCEAYGEGFITLARTGLPYTGKALPPASEDYDPLPAYREPVESPMSDPETAKEYPLVMTNGRVPYYHHSTLRNVPWLREIYPVPEVWITPDDAAKYGVEDGKWVWVESKRGKIRAKASVTTAIRPGTVYMERFWNPENLNSETHGWQEMNVNMLSRSEGPYNRVVGTYTLRGYLVKISPAHEAPEGVWTKPSDFRKWLPEYSDSVPELTSSEV